MKKFFTLVKKKGAETAMVSLEPVKAAAGVISVPALGPAAEILYSILEKVYQSQQNSGTVREIADLCLRAHATLAQHLQNMEITLALSDGIQHFEADLRNAQETVDKYEYKAWINRLVGILECIQCTLWYIQVSNTVQSPRYCKRYSGFFGGSVKDLGDSEHARWNKDGGRCNVGVCRGGLRLTIMATWKSRQQRRPSGQHIYSFSVASGSGYVQKFVYSHYSCNATVQDLVGGLWRGVPTQDSLAKDHLFSLRKVGCFLLDTGSTYSPSTTFIILHWTSLAELKCLSL
ncbi:hypothetical protein F5146DRAFT_1005013 [Armillaria mellea]|nr:hypothetical protein F5146DRAFT_1005013 [Armillaria mellea]